MMTIAEGTADPTSSSDTTTSTRSTITMATTETVANQATYVDYVLNIDDVDNPDFAHARTGSADMDITLAEDSASVDDPLWIKYDAYTTKFEMALYNALGDSTGTGTLKSTKAYGVYSSNWAGFKPSKSLLYVLDENKKDSKGELHVTAGL